MIGEVVFEYFRIMEEAEADHILGSLDMLMERFPEQIAAMAPMVVRKLVETFAGYVKIIEGNPDDDEASFSASSCLETLDNLLSRFIDTPGTLASVVEIMVPCIITVISHEKYFEFLENGFEFLNIFTCSKVHLQSDMLWGCCGTLLEILNGWAMDYLQEGCIALSNYIAMDIPRFVRSSTPSGVSYVGLLYQMSERHILFDNSETEPLGHSAALLLRQFFSQAAQSLPAGEREALKEMVWPVFALVATKITSQPFGESDAEEVLKHQTEVGVAGDTSKVYQPAEPSLYLLLCETALATIFYDAPHLMAKAMESEQNATLANAFFDQLFKACNDIQTFSGIRLLVLGLTELLKLDPITQMVPYLRDQVKPMFHQVVAELSVCYDGRNDVWIPEMSEHPRRSMYHHHDEQDWRHLLGDDDGDDDDLFPDEDEDEDDDDDEDDGTGIHSKKGIAAMKAKGLIPEGGYGEDEDAHAADEDEDYYAMLNREGDPDFEALRGTKYSNGMPVQVEYDHLGTLDHACSLDSLDISSYFIESVNSMEAARPGFIKGLVGQLDEIKAARFDQLAAVVSQRAVARQIVDPLERAKAIYATCPAISAPQKEGTPIDGTASPQHTGK